MADTRRSGRRERKLVRVRISSPAHKKIKNQILKIKMID